ncbi:ImmA/IrrE family metallo-endopeptidase [Dyadobacter chenhuakuii]|uniref:ImmA/IrrE family metallo-endopeptidase n=1 Tax=Dyadobacter chenhuakuii TaxID=2909339 RepID=A0A9X1QGZ2_9BACT|nr:ImmA/IrrE family metallo-endopeptidase [Dyadobacter chenhuakuii]MCF2495403.1 ImmA/IrrE family metallo-endopeptidase [Dyadobacter chenhuakuii]MCF2500132.1 ImmA/IrrE family metallo-endopeptidase [Dyadobacter chenhuakuii]USJ29441.1 ImmA/IrrE family metallo-endopeptidase [Dyadobacter chenhuakuii]
MSKNIKIERELLTKPGDTILETIEFLKMSQAELAERIGKTPAKVNDMISGKAPITVNTAMQLEKVLGIDMQFWLNREMLYREKLARIEQEEFLEEGLKWVKEQPIKELQKYGYLKANKVGTEMVEEFLKFYGVATPLQWQSMYVNSYASTNFRKSTAHATLLGSMAAWLRIGELKLRSETLPDFDREGFKIALNEIKSLVETQPEDFPSTLKSICEKVGVAVIYSYSLPKAPISGATRWIGKVPVIQITDRYKTNDHFWFTFFHEAAHILLHGKKDVFIEDFDGVENDPEKEAEANNFARDWLLPDTFLNEIDTEITERLVRKIARSYSTHPAIVVGRLQNLKQVPHHFGANMKVKINLEYFIEH